MIIKSDRFFIRLEANVISASLRTKKFTAEFNANINNQSRIITTVSELGHNILKYAGHGEITVHYNEASGQSFFEVLAVDDGPGISDIDQALKNDFSTGGTLGLGLPGIKRLMDDFIIDSSPGKGTKVTARKYL